MLLHHHKEYTYQKYIDTAKEPYAAALELSIGSQVDPGIRRRYKPNEDTILVTHMLKPAQAHAALTLFAVADGMGGQGHGQEASQLAIQSLVAYISRAVAGEQGSDEAWSELLRAAVHYANRMVYERNVQQHTVMGTTMTVVLVSATNAYIAHVGDSRLYLYRQSAGLVQLTHDHSLVATLVAEGIIAPDDIYTHPKRNLIYRCLGDQASVEVDMATVPLLVDDLLLCCSDGLWEMVRDRQIATLLTAPMPTAAATASALIQAALAGGGHDNVSAIVVRVSRSA